MKKLITIMCLAAAPIIFAQEKASKVVSAEQFLNEQEVEKKGPSNKKSNANNTSDANKKAEKAEANKKADIEKAKNKELKKQEIKSTEKKVVDNSAKSIKAN